MPAPLGISGKMYHADSRFPRRTPPHLEEAAYRVSAVAKAHERIHQVTGVDRLDLGLYVREVCQDLNEAVPLCQIEVGVEPGIDVMTDRAISIALMVNELITNAAKYAYQDDQGGTIWVRVVHGAVI
jgi:two-component sensor histidine kinase